MTGSTPAFVVLGAATVLAGLAAVLLADAVRAALALAATGVLAALLVALVEGEWWVALLLLCGAALLPAALVRTGRDAAGAAFERDAVTPARAGWAAAAAVVLGAATAGGAAATSGHLGSAGGATGWLAALVHDDGVVAVALLALALAAALGARALGHLDAEESRHLTTERERLARLERERRRREERERARAAARRPT